jgi:8-oxo-dGTP pyrophosphatase MutT (NUDIX family)
VSLLPALATKLSARVPLADVDPDRPRAAVAVVLAPEPPPDSVLLIRRAEREADRWSGQLAFPGGRWSKGDADLIATAKRETLEEVGVDLGPAQLIGILDDLNPRTPVLPPIVVRPFVFTLSGQVPLSLNQEVAGAWWLPLDEFLRPGVYGPMEYQRYGTAVRGLGYHLGVGLLWGMTERILTPLLDLARST